MVRKTNKNRKSSELRYKTKGGEIAKIINAKGGGSKIVRSKAKKTAGRKSFSFYNK